MPDHDAGEHGAGGDREVGEVARDRLDVVAGEVTERGPDGDPERGAQRVEEQEPRPVHAGDSRDDAVELTQTLDETRDHDDLAAMPVEELLAPVEPVAGEQHELAVPLDELAATEAADGVTHVVTGYGGEERHQPDEEHVEMPRAGVQRRSDEHGL